MEVGPTPTPEEELAAILGAYCGTIEKVNLRGLYNASPTLI
jgi:hypothetical protein